MSSALPRSCRWPPPRSRRAFALMSWKASRTTRRPSTSLPDETGGRMAPVDDQPRTVAAGAQAERLETSPAAGRSDYAELSRRIRQAGLLDRRPAYYRVKIGSITAMLAAGWVACFLVGDAWWQVAIAVYLAFAFSQVIFLGHDAGQRQVFRTRRANGLLGLVLGNLLIGLSFGWWVGKHNR